MNRHCILCRTKIKGITAILAVAVMLLLFTTGCKKEKREFVVVKFDPEKSFTMRETDVSTIISDSGITRYRLKSKLWLIFDKASDPHWFFPKGIYVEKFDSLFHTEASVKADTAYYYDKRGLWRLVGHVKVENLEGRVFETNELFWDQKEERVFSNCFMRIQDGEKEVTGTSFESDQRMTKYQIFNSTGALPINSERDSVAQEESATPQPAAKPATTKKTAEKPVPVVSASASAKKK